MIEFIVSKLHDARFMTMLLAAVAASATAYTLIMPLFAGEGLAKRMKAVASERERIRQRGPLLPGQAARVLRVDYLISGLVRRDVERLTVTVELVDVRDGRVVWTDVLKQRHDDALLVLDEIGNRIGERDPRDVRRRLLLRAAPLRDQGQERAGSARGDPADDVHQRRSLAVGRDQRR